MSRPTPDARAVVEAVDRLTTQVQRIADHLSTPVVRTEVRADDDATTPATTCDQPGPWGDYHACVRPAGHDGDHEAHDGCGWRVDETNNAPATDRCAHRGPHPGFTCAEVDASQPYFRVRWDQEQQAPAADEDAQRTTRRNSVAVLLARAIHGALSPTEGEELREHVNAEIREHDTMRAVAAGNKRHVQMMYADLQKTQAGRAEEERLRLALADERTRWKERAAQAETEAERLRDLVIAENKRADDAIDREQTAEQAAEEAQRERDQADEAARRALEQRQQMAEERFTIQTQRDTADRVRAEVQRDRDQHAAVLAEVLRQFTHETHPGRRCLQSGHVPVETVDRWRSVVQHDVERPWWVQVDTMRAELEQAQAAIERVQQVCHDLPYEHGRRILTALDGTEQPTTEAP